MYISSEVILIQDDEHMLSAQFISISKYDMENMITFNSSNPILDNHVHDVMFPFGSL